MAWEKVTSGQKLKQTPIHRAGFINDTIDVVNAYKEGRLQATPATSLQSSQSRVQVEVRNLTGSDLRPRPARPAWLAPAHQRLGRSSVVRGQRRCRSGGAAGSRFSPGRIKAGEIGPAQIAGVCLAYVFVLDHGSQARRTI